jgi:hypothetical protein
LSGVVWGNAFPLVAGLAPAQVSSTKSCGEYCVELMAETVFWPAIFDCAALALTIVSLWRRTNAGWMAACFFLLLAPTSSVVPVVERPIEENRTYLPLAVIVVDLVTSVSRWCGSRGSPCG